MQVEVFLVYCIVYLRPHTHSVKSTGYILFILTSTFFPLHILEGFSRIVQLALLKSSVEGQGSEFPLDAFLSFLVFIYLPETMMYLLKSSVMINAL